MLITCGERDRMRLSTATVVAAAVAAACAVISTVCWISSRFIFENRKNKQSKTSILQSVIVIDGGL